ncbi:MAG: SNF2-related protein [Bacilli bacterium]|nr:SNF2-related protein [Bacilli bacterium]
MGVVENIRSKYGDYLYYRAMSIPEWYIKRTNITTDAAGNKSVDFTVDIFYSGNFKVNIQVNEDGKVLENTCTCDDYKNNHICQHIIACVLKKKEAFFTNEELSLQKSRNILKEFITKEEPKLNKLKEEIGLDIEVSYLFSNYIVKLKIGEKTKYTIKNRDKFNEFRACYLNGKDMVLGKKLTYNPNNYFFNNENTKIIEYLFNYSEIGLNRYEVIDEPLKLNNREFSELLKLLENKRFTLEDIPINKIESGFPTLYHLELVKDKYKFYIEDFANFKIVDNDSNYIIYNNVLYILKLEDRKIVTEFVDNEIESLVFDKKNLDLFKNGLLKKTMNTLEVSEDIKDIKIIKDKKINLYFDLSQDSITAKVMLKYAEAEFNYFDTVSGIIRDAGFEAKVIDDLTKYGFIEDKKNFVILDMDSTYNFLDNGLSYFTENYTVFTTEKIKKLKIFKDVKVRSNFSIGKDNILAYDFAIDNVDNKEISSLLTAIKSRKKYYRLKSGDVISLFNNQKLQDFESLTNDLELDSKDLNKKSITIPKYRAFFIESLKNNRYQEISTNSKFDEFIKNFSAYKNADVKFNDEETKLLRDYQKEGVKWLYTIYKCDLGGILADEMGLGKTLQAIIFLRKIIAEKPDAKILIVSPTSLVYNWEKEFQKFAPELKYVAVAESKKKRQEIMQNFANYNIFITTYGLVRNDNDEYESKDFEVCIIDEAQAIKNYQAGMTKEIKKIKARTKIALTGTPLENSVLELWSIFDFIMPGYLNSIVRFREAYGIKDVDKDSLKRLDNLNYQIRPFILRRKKKEVSKELPDKIEQIEYLDMSETEKAMYQSLVEDTKEEIDNVIASEGFSKARFKIVTLLTRLRQLCISPALLDKDYTDDSIKIKRLLEIVKELIKDNHKILIFSSFKGAVLLVKKKLDEESISNYVIDGSVSGKDRVMLVDAFNKDKTSCFLITLKSGGTGLNLTSADIVIHLDVWWNPQVENQATDRAHRIGQTKKVTVLKLINKGTVEEKIIELQEKKRILSDNLIEGKNTTTLDTLTEEELTNLLSIGYETDKESNN